MLLFARHAEENRWLSEHPVVLGGGAAILGLVLLGLGISALKTGRATAKRGPDLEGANARMMGFVWVGFGALCLLFGAFKIVGGLL